MQKPYYEKPGFVLYHANCLYILAELPENSVNMVFADPSYLLSNDVFTVHAGRRVIVNKGEWEKSNGLEKDFNFHLEWIKAVKRVLKPQGTIKNGDLILDPFTDDSTTRIAAYLLGRQIIGIDIEKKYLNLSIKRFDELKDNLSCKQKLLKI